MVTHTELGSEKTEMFFCSLSVTWGIFYLYYMLNVQAQSWYRPGMNVKNGHRSCLCCPGPTETLSLDTAIYFGFGGWTIRKDGILFFQGTDDYDEAPTLLKFEELAREEPLSEWVAELYSPLRGATYQRHGYDNWVLIETNEGFA